MDSSIILDILLDDPDYAARSLGLLENHFAMGSLIICPVVHAESAACLQPPSRFVEVAEGMNLIYEDFDREACVLAAETWRRYRNEGGVRTRLLADFLIGAHTQTHADLLLSRDRGFFRKYFRGLEVIQP